MSASEMKEIISILFVFAIFQSLAHCKKPLTENKSCTSKRVLVISFDGFRWNYLSRTETPNFDKFINNGVQARRGLKNAFITKTFPNHYTLATGLWEESHNIVANDMYDPLLNQTFQPSNHSAQIDPAWFDMGGEPIWVTNQVRGNGHSGIYMWVGNAAPVHNVLPTKFQIFESGYKNESKVDTVISWLKEDCEMNLAMLYFPLPDRTGHKFGPESEQVTRMIGGLDELMGYLLKRFKEEDLLDNTNIIVTSDHGFASTPAQKRVDLDEIINRDSRKISDISPVAAIWPHKGYMDDIYKNLTAAAKENGHFTVYKKENLPERFHYKVSRRIAPILVVADEFYSFNAHEFRNHKLGDHGYDNKLGDMHPFFLAMGPDFKSGYSVETFESVDVYPLVCHLLGVQPAPNNGSMKIVSKLLKESIAVQETNKWRQPKYLVPMGLVGGLIVIAMIASVIYTCRPKGTKKKTIENGDDEEDLILYCSESDKEPLLF